MFASTRNCNGFFKTNPPAVVFLLCLVILTVTTFCLTFYIRNVERIVNGDDRQNWISLTESLNKAELCAVNNDSTANLNRHIENEVRFVTLVGLNLSRFDGAKTVEAYYDLQGWQPLCESDDNSTHFLNVIIPLSSFLEENDTNYTKVCGIIIGPKEFLPENSTLSCNVDDNENNTIVLHSDSRFCSNSANLNHVKLEFDKDSEFVTYLTQNDKSIIYIHLSWASYILLFWVMIILIYAMFYQTENKYQPTELK